MLSMYPACFFKKEKGYTVIFPDLGYLAAFGDTFEDAMSMAIDYLASYLHTAQRDGDVIPGPSKISEINIEQISKDVYKDEPACECIVNIVSVDVAEYAKQHFDKSVRKTLTIPAWLNNAALAQGINFSQTLQEALLSKVQSR